MCNYNCGQHMTHCPYIQTDRQRRNCCRFHDSTAEDKLNYDLFTPARALQAVTKPKRRVTQGQMVMTSAPVMQLHHTSLHILRKAHLPGEQSYNEAVGGSEVG